MDLHLLDLVAVVLVAMEWRDRGINFIQIPTTFRDPVSTVGAPGPTSPAVTGADTSGKYYVAGGGAGGNGGSAKGGGAGGPYAGSGDTSTSGPGGFALNNTGSGGGGDHAPGSAPDNGGNGGSGLVLIAYPS